MTRARDLGDFIADGGVSQLEVEQAALIALAIKLAEQGRVALLTIKEETLKVLILAVGALLVYSAQETQERMGMVEIAFHLLKII